MKKLRNLLFAFIGFTSVSLQSCASPVEKKQASEQVTDNNSVLWEITGKGLQKPSYLFGTIHLICPDDYIWSEKMQQTLDKAEKVCLEMDMDDMGVVGTVSAGFMDLSGKQLKDYFKSDDFTKISKYFKDTLGYDLAAFNRMKPFVLIQLMIPKLYPCAEPVAYEQKIMSLVQPANKEIIGLETAEEQLAVIGKIETDSLIKSILEVVEGDTESLSELQELVAAYKKQDLNQLKELMAETEDMGPEAAKALLEERNTRWIPRMEKMMKENSVFFAVGAGHLPGDKGVIELLKKAGYTVTPVK